MKYSQFSTLKEAKSHIKKLHSNIRKNYKKIPFDDVSEANAYIMQLYNFKYYKENRRNSYLNKGKLEREQKNKLKREQNNEITSNKDTINEDIPNEVTSNEFTSNEFTSNEVTSNEVTSNEFTSNEFTSNEFTSNEVIIYDSISNQKKIKKSNSIIYDCINNNLPMNNHHTLLCKNISEYIIINNMISCHRVDSVAAGIIYFISDICTLHITPRQIHESCGIGQSTTKNCYKKLHSLYEEGRLKEFDTEIKNCMMEFKN